MDQPVKVTIATREFGGIVAQGGMTAEDALDFVKYLIRQRHKTAFALMSVTGHGIAITFARRSLPEGIESCSREASDVYWYRFQAAAGAQSHEFRPFLFRVLALAAEREEEICSPDALRYLEAAQALVSL